MSPRERRLHAGVGAPALDDMQMDGGAVLVERCALRTSGSVEHAAVLTSFSPRVAGSASKRASVLAHAPSLEPLEPSGPDALARDVRFEWDGSTLRAQVRIERGASYYGLGLAAGPLLRDGRTITLWNTDAWRYGEESPALYQSHPWVLALLPDGRALGVLVDSPARGAILVAPDGVEVDFEDASLDVIVIEAATPEDVLRALAALIGPMSMPPLWSLGYHQCRWSYMDEREVLEIARQLRDRKIPCDAIWLDIDHLDRLRVFTWDSKRFPDPKKLCAALHADGFKVVSILDPGVACAPDYAVFTRGLELGAFVNDARGALARGRVWPGVCAFPDFANEGTRAWWSRLVKDFVLASGVDGLWCDMNEPALFRTPRKTLPDDARHATGPHARVHNLYGQLMASATRAGIAGARPEEKPFVLTRANHIAGARVAATWTGDNQATWEDLGWSIPMVLNLGLSGQPFSGPDIGGFDGDPSPELFARWFELGSLLPFARGHSEKSACRKEPWSFGPVIEAVVRTALERRMRLLPHLYTLFEESARTGLPVARPLCLADPRDARLRGVEDQFLLGRDLLVAPIVRAGANAREVILPANAGGWFALERPGAPIHPLEARVAAPLGDLPVFARAGSIVCTGPACAHTGLARAGQLDVCVFLDAHGTARGRLYEDDDSVDARAHGRFRETTFQARASDSGVVVERETRGELSLPPRAIAGHARAQDGRLLPVEFR